MKKQNSKTATAKTPVAKSNSNVVKGEVKKKKPVFDDELDDPIFAGEDFYGFEDDFGDFDDEPLY